MTFDPTLTKYISTDPTKTRLISDLYHGEIEHTKLEWAFLLISKRPYLRNYIDMLEKIQRRATI